MVDTFVYKLVPFPKEKPVVREGAGGTIFNLGSWKIEGIEHKVNMLIIFDAQNQVVVLPIPVVVHALVDGDPGSLRAYGKVDEFDLTRYDRATYTFHLNELGFRLYIHKNLDSYPDFDERDIIEAEVRDGLLTGDAHVIDRKRVEKGYRHYIMDGADREYFNNWEDFVAKIKSQ